jgi:hypothetical protein
MVKVRVAFAVLVTVALLGIAACNDDDDGDDGGTTTGAAETGTSGGESGGPIVIRTQLAPVNAEGETTGEVLSGSTIGGSAFCAGGKFSDIQREPPLVERTFRCDGGTLLITFTSTPPDVEQRSDWEVVRGLGSFEGLSGGGRMRAVSESSGEPRETFTGTVSR